MNVLHSQMLSRRTNILLAVCDLNSTTKIIRPFVNELNEALHFSYKCGDVL